MSMYYAPGIVLCSRNTRTNEKDKIIYSWSLQSSWGISLFTKNIIYPVTLECLQCNRQLIECSYY